MSYDIILSKAESTQILSFDSHISHYENQFLNSLFDSMPYHLKFNFWQSSDNKNFYFQDTPNNHNKGYFKNNELFQKDYQSLKNNGISFSGITENELFYNMKKFISDFLPNLQNYQYFLAALIFQNQNYCSFSSTIDSLILTPNDKFIRDTRLSELILIKQLFNGETNRFFNQMFNTQLTHRQINGFITIPYIAENQHQILSILSKNENLEIKNFDANLNLFNIEHSFNIQKIDNNFLGLPESFKTIVQFIEMNDKYSPLNNKKITNKI